MAALLLPLLVVSLAALGALAWAFSGLPALLTVTYGLMDFCQSLLVRCVEYSAILKVVFVWAGFLTLFTGLLYGLGTSGVNLLRSLRAVKKLPLSPRSSSVVLIRDGSGTAFTHGLLNPRIYISTGLIGSLDKGELKAVLLHELHHRKRRDPLRFFLLNLLKDSFFYIPAVRHLAQSAIARGEHEADEAGAVAGPLSLASALVKVASFNRAASISMQASITGGGPGAGSMTARVERLVEGSGFTHPGPSLKSMAASVVTAVLLSVSLLLPLFGSQAAACTTEHCALHSKMLGKDCRTHCETSSHGTHSHHHHG